MIFLHCAYDKAVGCLLKRHFRQWSVGGIFGPFAKEDSQICIRFLKTLISLPQNETFLCHRFTRFVMKYNLMSKDNLIVPILEEEVQSATAGESDA